MGVFVFVTVVTHADLIGPSMVLIPAPQSRVRSNIGAPQGGAIALFLFVVFVYRFTPAHV